MARQVAVADGSGSIIIISRVLRLLLFMRVSRSFNTGGFPS